MTFPARASLAVGPHQLHGFRNDTDIPATLKVTATPAGDLDRVLRTLSGLSRDGLLVPGKPPQHPLAMANLAYRSRYYSPPLPRWLYWTPIGAMAPFAACACRKARPCHATRRYSLIRPPTRACFQTRYWPRSSGSGSGFSGAAPLRERCGRC